MTELANLKAIADKLVYMLRCKVGGWLYFLGYRILPLPVRKRVQTINAIGLRWAEHECPNSFSIEIDEKVMP